MVTIIIKSFNRAFYLDRCLQSIFDNAKGEYDIKILDDGTPHPYLDQILRKYPIVNIIKSNQYPQKIEAIECNLQEGKKIDGFTIPTEMWYREVQSASDYVLVIEDDVWLTTEVNFDELIRQMRQYNIPLLRLGWLGNYTEDEYCDIQKINNDISFVKPKKLFTGNKMVMDFFMYNKYKFFTILYKLGIVDNGTKLKYWTINSILMGLYRKDYWLAIWADAQGKVDEKQQLRNAAVWYHNHKEVNFARSNEESLKTTFKSSATGSYHEFLENKFDANRMNYILNEAWYHNQFDVMENYPKDFSDAYIKKFLDGANHHAARYTDWYIWAEQFREQYRNLGANVL